VVVPNWFLLSHSPSVRSLVAKFTEQTFSLPRLLSLPPAPSITYCIFCFNFISFFTNLQIYSHSVDGKNYNEEEEADELDLLEKERRNAFLG
jgi:hypothetical protein